MNIHLSKLCLALLITTSIVAHGQNAHPTYEQWKETKIKQWGKDSSFVNNIQELFMPAILINPSVEKMGQQCEMPIRLYAYNFLREITEKKPIKTTDEFDETWLQKIYNQLDALTTKEEFTNQKRITLADPEPWQTALIKEARKATNITTDQIIYSAKFPYDSKEDVSFYVDQISGTTSTIFMIAHTHKLDELLFHIYHELGHVKHHDADPVKILNKQYPAFEEEYYQATNTIENFSKDFPITNTHLELVKSYVACAKNTLDASTNTGKKILESIAELASFWNAPKDNESYIKTAIGRAIESRADLFACEHLLEQNKLDPILYIIRSWGTSDKRVSDTDIHPSLVERALYMAGFLLSKGIDINKALHDFKQNWQPKDARQLYNSTNTQTSIEEDGDLIKAYKQQEQPKKQDPVYEHYKKDTDKDIDEKFETNKHPTASKSIVKIAVLYFITWYEITGLDMIKEKQDPDLKREFTVVAITYNYLREFLNQPIIDSIDEIDKAWLNTAPYAFFKKEKEAEWNKKNIVNFKDRIKDLLSPESIKPSRVTPPGLAFFNYNFARELCGQPTVQLDMHRRGIPFDLDQSWIEKQLAQ